MNKTLSDFTNANKMMEVEIRRLTASLIRFFEEAVKLERYEEDNAQD